MFTRSEHRYDPLAELSILEGLGGRERRDLTRHVDEIRVEADQVLIRQGTLNRHAYFVVSGSLAVDIDGQRVATVGPDGIVGERTALRQAHLANATVRTLEPSVLVVMEHRALRGLTRINADIGEQLDAIIDERAAA